MTQEITPDKQSVLSCLSQKSYYIDFYQREYVWESNTVNVLLKDIFYSFNLSYNEHKDEELSQKTIMNYNWYYLNVFITNKVDGKVYIVDGQQRLTTLTLIACKLFHMTSNENLRSILLGCIFTKDLFQGNIFCIDHDKRKDVMQAILDGKEYKEKFKNKTEETLIERYKDVSAYFDKLNMEEDKVEAFIYYFLQRLVLVELSIDKDDTPMVFEVINDRGEALKPFEILKGKMIGLLSKSDTDLYSSKWDESMLRLPEIQDTFFIDYIRSRFIFRSNASVESSISKSYHRYIFDNNDIADTLAFRKTDKMHITNIKNFINNELSYYSKLYAKITTSKNTYLRYEKEINSFSGQYQNIMAACCVNDVNEDAKIDAVAREVDRMWVILTLNGAYDSNEYQNITYALNEQLRGKDISEYRDIFNQLIIDAIRHKRNITDENAAVALLDYNTFQKRGYSNLNTRFLRYFLSRVEDYICTESKVKMQNDVFYVSTKTGNITGYQIEHILSNNDESVKYFDNEDEYNERRNQLGGLLLLKGLDNISSGNELYVDKLKTYGNGFVWGHTLCKDFYHANLDFEAFNKRLKDQTGVEFKPYDVFDKQALEERCTLLFNLVKIIWDIK